MREGRGDFLRNASRAAGKHKQSLLPSFLGAFIGGVGFGGSLGRVRDIDWFGGDHNIGHLRSCPAIPQKWWKDPTGEETIAKINLFCEVEGRPTPYCPADRCANKDPGHGQPKYTTAFHEYSPQHMPVNIYSHTCFALLFFCERCIGEEVAMLQINDIFPSSFFWTEKGHQWKSFPRPQRKLHSSENGFFAL